MIGYDDFKALEERAGSDYPPNDAEKERAWWAARGVDADALTAWCVEQSTDDILNTLPEKMREAPGLPVSVVIAGGFGMAYEIGFLFGWLLHEKARAAQKDEIADNLMTRRGAKS